MTDRETDVIVVGAGLAGLVATAELVDAGRRVILVEQEPEASFGGQAWWSLGGLFLVDTLEQRRPTPPPTRGWPPSATRDASWGSGSFAWRSHIG
jgi:predicted oxidoreductase